MSHIDLDQPDLAAPRAAAGHAESAEAQVMLLNAYQHLLAGAGPLAPSACCLAHSLPKAGPAVHHCARRDPMYLFDGARQMPPLAERGTGRRSRGTEPGR